MREIEPSAETIEYADTGGDGPATTCGCTERPPSACTIHSPATSNSPATHLSRPATDSPSSPDTAAADSRAQEQLDFLASWSANRQHDQSGHGPKRSARAASSEDR
jgi:hypothetical protein